MSYTVAKFEEVEDFFGGKWAGEMRMLTGPLESEQVALTVRRMPKGAGGRGGYGHRHRQQEEIYVVMEGRLTFKLDDEEFEAGPHAAVRVSPETARSVHNDHDEDVWLLIVSTRGDGPDHELVEGFWA